MDRNVAAGVVVGVVGLTAALLFLLAPSTGPDVSRAKAEPVAVAPMPEVAVQAAPSPAPTRRRPVRRGPRRPDGVQIPGAPQVRGDVEPIPISPRRLLANGPLRGRYTEKGYERILTRIDAIATDLDWDDNTHAEVVAIVEASQEAGNQVLQKRLDGDFSDPGSVATALHEVRMQEVDELRQVLGEKEADQFVEKAGLGGRSMKRPMGPMVRQQPIEE